MSKELTFTACVRREGRITVPVQIRNAFQIDEGNWVTVKIVQVIAGKTPVSDSTCANDCWWIHGKIRCRNCPYIDDNGWMKANHPIFRKKYEFSGVQ